MRKSTPPTYRTKNWRTYNAALTQRGSLQVWFDPETIWLAEPGGKRGRAATFTDAAIQTCLMLKALFGLPLWQTTGLVASLLRFAGLDWAVPDFSTLSRRPSGLNVAIPYWPSTGALHLPIDIEPVSATGSSEPARDAARVAQPDPSRSGHRLKRFAFDKNQTTALTFFFAHFIRKPRHTFRNAL